jgi:hypothetical protein
MSAWRTGRGRAGRGMLLAFATTAMLVFAMGASAYAEGGCSRGFTDGLTEPSVIEGIYGATSWSTGGGRSVLEGEGFEYATAVTVGDQPASGFAVISDEELEFTAPAEDPYAVEHGHEVEAVVTTPGGQSYSCPSGRNRLTYTTPVPPSGLSIAPHSGPEAGGTPVTIGGTGFTQNEVSPSAVTAVDFGSTPATSFEALSAHKLRAIAPAGKGSQEVRVTTAAGTSSGGESNFTYDEPAPPPVVEFVEPDEGPLTGGNTVEIWAHHAEGLTAVKFGAHAATSFKTTGVAGVIEAVVPAGGGTVDVSLTAAAGTSATSAKDRYSYVTGPTVTKVEPASGRAEGSTEVRIKGTGFGSASAVRFGGTEASIIKQSPSEILVLSPAGSGTVDVTVTTPGGTSAAGAADRFTYLPKPVITKLNPAGGPQGGGNTVTITGTGLSHTTSVRFGAVHATSFKVESDSVLTAVAPAGSEGSTVRVTAEAPEDSSELSAATLYKYATQPATPELTPAEGPATGGQTVTLSGLQYTGATAVSFGGTPASSFEVLSDKTIKAVTPAGSGTVDVTVTTPGGTTPVAERDRYTYLSTPVVTGLTPSSAFEVTVEIPVVIHGEHFVAPLTVEADGQTILAQVLSESELRIAMPRGSGSTHVRVSTPGGTSATSAADAFTYIPRPAITSISPSKGPAAGGTRATITGTDLGHAPAVSFGASAAKAIQQVSETEIVAVSPPGTGTVDVTVEGENGASSTGAADRFSYEPAPAQPHFGRCTQVPAGPGKTYSGGYQDKKCEHVEPGHKGKYEWSPGLAKPTLTVSGGPITVTIEWNNSVIACASAGGDGEMDGTTAITGIQIVLHGCKHGSQSCSSGATAGDIATNPLEGTIGFEFKGKGKAALELAPEVGEQFVSFSCGGEEAIVLVHGVFAAVKAGKSATSLALTYKSAKGAQKPRAFEGATSISSLEVAGAFSSALINGTLKLNAEESFEINPVQ